MIEEIFSMLFSLIGIMFVSMWYLLKLTVIYLWRHPRVLLLTLIVLFVTFFQFYRLSANGSTLGTDPSDVAAAKEIVSGHIFITGPKDASGSYATGPLYYHLATPFLWLFGGQATGIIVMVEFVILITVYLLFNMGKNFFISKEAGLFAAALYAVSSLVITNARASAIPVLILFFALLLIQHTFNSVSSAKPIKYFILSGFFLGLCIQLNSFALYLGIIILLYFFFAEWLMNEHIMWKTNLKHYAFFFLGLLLGLFSYLAADFPLQFANIKSMFSATFGTMAQTIQTLGVTIFPNMLQAFLRVFAQVVFNFPTPDRLASLQTGQLVLWEIFILAFIAGAFYLIGVFRNRFILLMLGLWLIPGIFFYTLYPKGQDYHFTYFFPLSFLLIGNVLGFIYKSFEQDKFKTEEIPMGKGPNGEEMYQVVPVKKTDKKKLFIHILFATCSLMLFSIIAILNFVKFA